MEKVEELLKMVKPKIIKILSIGLTAAFLAGAFSFFIKIVSCRFSYPTVTSIDSANFSSIFKNL